MGDLVGANQGQELRTIKSAHHSTDIAAAHRRFRLYHGQYALPCLPEPGAAVVNVHGRFAGERGVVVARCGCRIRVRLDSGDEVGGHVTDWRPQRR